MMDPVGLKAMAYFPKPNQAGSPFTETNNWFEQGVNASSSHQMNFKGDHNFNSNNRLSGRYSYGRGVGNPANLFGEALAPSYTFNDGPNQGARSLDGRRLYPAAKRHIDHYFPLWSTLTPPTSGTRCRIST